MSDEVLRELVGAIREQTAAIREQTEALAIFGRSAAMAEKHAGDALVEVKGANEAFAEEHGKRAAAEEKTRLDLKLIKYALGIEDKPTGPPEANGSGNGNGHPPG